MFLAFWGLKRAKKQAKGFRDEWRRQFVQLGKMLVYIGGKGLVIYSAVQFLFMRTENACIVRMERSCEQVEKWKVVMNKDEVFYKYCTLLFGFYIH